MDRYEEGDRVRLLRSTGDEPKSAAKIERVWRFGPGSDYLSLRWSDGATAYVREDMVKRA